MAVADFDSLLCESVELSSHKTEKLRPWLRVRPPSGGVLPLQGWKLHVSASESNAAEVLRRVLPLLAESGAEFKLTADIATLRSINSGGLGHSQRGKFLTVYPANEAEAVRLARALDSITAGIEGPPIPTDRRLRPGSIVHYRYGSFSAGHMQNKVGILLPCIEAPSGELVPDIRTRHYIQPEWLTDPFGGIDAQPKLPVLAGRYVAVALLYESARGLIWSAANLENNRAVILKQHFGSLEEHPLARERDLLIALDGANFPRVLDYLATPADGVETLVLEDLEALTLEKWTEQQANAVGAADIRKIMLGIVEALEQLHALGIVHRDVKASNIMLRDPGRVFLIDLEISQRDGTTGREMGRGTLGYASRQQWELAPVSYRDDVYALGAVLYFLLTGAVPSAAPAPWSLLDRDPLLLNPSADPILIALAKSCLSYDPEFRPTLREAKDILEGVTVPALAHVCRPNWEDCSAERFLELALSTANTMVPEARQNGVTVWWHGKEREGLPERSLGSGDAGTLFALTELAAVSRWQKHLDAVSEAAERLQHTLRARGEPHPGLYVGEAGVALAILRAGELLRRPDLMESAGSISRLVMGAKHFSPDLFNGTAGRVRMHLRMYETTGDRDELAAALAGTELLLNQAVWDNEGGCSWVIPEGFGSMTGHALLGYAHGAAGIGDVLCEVWDVAPGEALESAIRGAYTWIMRYRTADVPANSHWSEYPEGPFRGPLWCHGSAGVGLFLLRYAAMPFCTDREEVLSNVRRAAAAVASERRIGSVLCHGLAGNVEFLLDVHEHTGEERWRGSALELSQLLMAFGKKTEDGYVFVGDKGETAPNLMTGYAGIALTLLRLSGHGLENQSLRLKVRRHRMASSS